ncbi:MAG: hypothetical protein IJR60_02985 [Eubacterium sp.]|nr:hypothetical protein [Eubacterium sp.]
MDNYILKRLSCVLLSLLLTLSLVVALLSLTGVITLRSSNYMSSKISACSAEFEKAIKAEVLEEMQSEAVSADICADAVNADVMNHVVTVTAKNAALGSANDFSFDKTLYNLIVTSLNNNMKAQNVTASAAEIANAASLEVDVINSVMSQVETSDIPYISFFQSKVAGTAVLAGVALAVAAIVLIDLVNGGRHRKNSYIGMSFASAGAIQIFGALAMLNFGFDSAAMFSENAAFNSAMTSALQTVIKAQIIYGIALVLIAYTVLIINYRYFSKKNVRVKEQREVNEKMRREYMRHYEQKNAPRPEPIPGEREEHKIDF